MEMAVVDSVTGRSAPKGSTIGSSKGKPILIFRILSISGNMDSTAKETTSLWQHIFLCEVFYNFIDVQRRSRGRGDIREGMGGRTIRSHWKAVGSLFSFVLCVGGGVDRGAPFSPIKGAEERLELPHHGLGQALCLCHNGEHTRVKY